MIAHASPACLACQQFSTQGPQTNRNAGNSCSSVIYMTPLGTTKISQCGGSFQYSPNLILSCPIMSLAIGLTFQFCIQPKAVTIAFMICRTSRVSVANNSQGRGSPLALGFYLITLQLLQLSFSTHEGYLLNFIFKLTKPSRVVRQMEIPLSWMSLQWLFEFLKHSKVGIMLSI